jgi:outer membrane protein assembly factor BamB
MLIPNTDIILCGDKHGALTLLNVESLGKTHPDSSQLFQTLPVKGGRVLGGPAWWNNNLYIWGEADVLKCFRFNGKTLDPAVRVKADVRAHGSPGGTLTVSANGSASGTGIVWGMLTLSKSADHGNAAGALHAFDADTLTELWNTEQNPKRDRLGTLVKFVPPTVANGRVYAPTYDNRVMVYGLLTPQR